MKHVHARQLVESEKNVKVLNWMFSLVFTCVILRYLAVICQVNFYKRFFFFCCFLLWNFKHNLQYFSAKKETFLYPLRFSNKSMNRIHKNFHMSRHFVSIKWLLSLNIRNKKCKAIRNSYCKLAQNVKSWIHKVTQDCICASIFVCTMHYILFIAFKARMPLTLYS